RLFDTTWSGEFKVFPGKFLAVETLSCSRHMHGKARACVGPPATPERGMDRRARGQNVPAGSDTGGGRDDKEGSRFAFCQTTRDICPAEGLRTVLRGQLQDQIRIELRMLTVDKACLLEHTEVGIGCKAIGAQRDADASLKKGRQGIGLVSKGRMGARAV